LRNGTYKKLLYPGRYTYNVCTENIKVVSLKTESLKIGTQHLMTNDNLSVTIDAVCFFNVSDAEKAIFNVENYKYSIDSLCKTTLRTVIGENDLNLLFSQRTIINKRINELIENYAKNWGISNVNIEIRDVELPESLKRSMAQISEAKMAAQAKIINAEADSKAVDILKEASKNLVNSPETLNLLWFNTLKEISKEKSNTIIASENAPKFLNKMLYIE
jgi:regulator of protease activity HflC (stomatin/prohibitin superfamily)